MDLTSIKLRKGALKNLKSFWAKLNWNILTSLNACSSMVSAPGGTPYIWKWMLNRKTAIDIFAKLTWRPKWLLWQCVQKLNPSCLCTPSPVIWLPQPRTWSSGSSAQTTLSGIWRQLVRVLVLTWHVMHLLWKALLSAEKTWNFCANRG